MAMAEHPPVRELTGGKIRLKTDWAYAGRAEDPNGGMPSGADRNSRTRSARHIIGQEEKDDDHSGYADPNRNENMQKQDHHGAYGEVYRRRRRRCYGFPCEALRASGAARLRLACRPGFYGGDSERDAVCKVFQLQDMRLGAGTSACVSRAGETGRRNVGVGDHKHSSALLIPKTVETKKSDGIQLRRGEPQAAAFRPLRDHKDFIWI